MYIALLKAINFFIIFSQPGLIPRLLLSYTNKKQVFILIYIVKEGDSVDSIALHSEVPVNTILYENQIPYPY
jgi:hypothetical protein